MAHFYGNMGSGNGEVTRAGTRNSGIWGHIRGWDVGVRVLGSTVTDEHGNVNDVFAVYLTSGSGGGRERLLGCFSRADIADCECDGGPK